jgi:AraC-like DNA-binding protein
MAGLVESMARMTTTPRSAGPAPPLRHRQVIDDMQLSIAGSQMHKRQWIHHRFAVTGIGLVTRGRGMYRAGDGEEHIVEAGSLFSVYPGPTFHYGPIDGTSWAEYHVCAAGTGVRRWVRWGLVPTDGRVHRTHEVGKSVEQFRRLIAVYRRGGPADADRALLLAEQLLLELLHRRERPGARPPISPHAERALAYCERHLADPIDMPEVAARFAMSYSAFRQQVRRATGLPPGQYLTRLRCEAACRLLHETSLRISEVGPRVGIEDPFTFSRTFKRCVGVSPRDYRRQSVR